MRVRKADPAGLAVANRQPDMECGADANFAFDADRSAQQFSQSFGKGKSKAGAFDPGLQFALYLNELLEDPLLVLSSDADAGIRNLKGDKALALQLGCKANVAAASELQRVRDQVAQNLGDFAFVRIERREVWGRIEDQFKAVAGQERFQHSPQCAEEILNLKVPRFDVDLACFYFGQVKQVVDELGEFGCRSLDVENLLFLLRR